MKWFRITSLGWQVAIVLALVIFLGWDNTPVQGPDGRVTVELYEFPVVPGISPFKSMAIHVIQPKWKIISDKAAIVGTVKHEPNRVLKWILDLAPSLRPALPQKYLFMAKGGWCMEVSLTLDEWRALNEMRKLGPLYIGCLNFE